MHTEIRISKMDEGFTVESNTYANKNSRKAGGFSMTFCDSVGRICKDEKTGEEMVFCYIKGREGNIGYKVGKVVYDCREEKEE